MKRKQTGIIILSHEFLASILNLSRGIKVGGIIEADCPGLFKVKLRYEGKKKEILPEVEECCPIPKVRFEYISKGKSKITWI